MKQVEPMKKRGQQEEKKKELDFIHFLSKTSHQNTKTKPDSVKSIFSGHRLIASSPLASIGAVDSFGMTTDAQKWLRENELHTNADRAFMSSKAPNKTSRLWNDTSINDSDFAADEEIVDNRQLSADKPFVPHSSTFR